MASSPVALPFALGLSAAVLWGVADFLAKKRAESDGVWETLAPLSLVGTVAFTAACAWRSVPFPRPGVLAWWLAAGALNFLGYVALYRGFRVGSLTVVSTANATWAGITVLLAVVFLGEVPTRAGWAGVALTVAGVMLVARGAGGFSLRDRGLREGVASAALFAASFFVLKQPRAHGDPVAQAAAMRAVALVASVSVLAYRRAMTPARLRPSLFAALDSLGFLAFVAGLATGATAVVAPLGSLLTPVTAALAAVFLRERLAPRQYAGFAMVVAGAVVLGLAG